MTTGDPISNAVAFDTYKRFRPYVHVEEDVCAFFEQRFLERRGWDAVVVDEEINKSEAAHLAAACRHFGYKKATALDIDHFDSGFFHKIELNEKDLLDLEKTFYAPSYLVVEQEERFMLVSDSDYYWSIAGSRAFIEQCFGKSIESKNQEFLDATHILRRGPTRIGHALNRIAAEITRPASMA